MERIAIPVRDQQVSPHIGHAEFYLIAEIADGKVVSTAELPNPGHGPGGPPPVFIANQGVQRVLAWGAPEHVHTMLQSRGVALTLGCTGNPHDLLADYIRGELKLTTEGLDGGPCSCNH